MKFLRDNAGDLFFLAAPFVLMLGLFAYKIWLAPYVPPEPDVFTQDEIFDRFGDHM